MKKNVQIHIDEHKPAKDLVDANRLARKHPNTIGAYVEELIRKDMARRARIKLNS